MSTSPIAPDLLRPVLAPTLGRARTLPAEAYTSQAVFDWESVHLFEQGVGLRRARRRAGRAPATSEPSASGTKASWWCAATTASCEASTTRAATEDTSCSSPARRGTSARSSAPTTRGSTRSTESLGAAPRFGALEGFDKQPIPADRRADRGVARLGLRERRTAAAPRVRRARRQPRRAARSLGDRSACSWPRPTSTRSRRTGRRSPRTTTSATTAPRSTLRSAT